MRKRSTMLALVLTMGILTGCSGNGVSKDSENTQPQAAIGQTTTMSTTGTASTTSTKVAVTTKPTTTPSTTSARGKTTVTRLKKYNNNVIEYTVSESWAESVKEENKYYYPEDGMLMVSTMEDYFDLNDSANRKGFMDGMADTDVDLEYRNERTAKMDGTDGYLYDVIFSIEGKDYNGTLALGEKDRQMAFLLLGIESESKNDYDDEFKRILRSVKFLEKQVSSEEDILKLAKEIVEKSFDSEIEVKGSAEDQWVSFNLGDKALMDYFGDYETDQNVRDTWETIKEFYLEISKKLSEAAPGYSLLMANPVNPEKTLLILKDDVVVYDYFAELDIKSNGEEPEEEPEEDPEDDEPTQGQQNAVRSAENYISFMPFSKKGLIKQLEYEGYSSKDAKYAVENIEVDWYEQAALSAANYLDLMSFSRKGLIDQLIFEGFTEKQAVYGVEENGY